MKVYLRMPKKIIKNLARPTGKYVFYDDIDKWVSPSMEKMGLTSIVFQYEFIFPQKLNKEKES